MRVLIIVLTGFLVGGCTAAGPFVTNISSDGNGSLIVERNMVHMNAFMGTVSLGENPHLQTIPVCPSSNQKYENVNDGQKKEEKPDHFSIRKK